MTKLEKLFFAIGVQDKGASKGVARLQKNIETMTKRARANIRSLGVGIMGVVGAGLSIKAIAGPAIELNRALADVGALGVDTEGLKVLQQESGRFAMQYGKSASDVLRSSVAIQERIDGLTAHELAAFTSASNILSMSSRSSVESMTGYMSTMFGLFEKEAGRMGKIRWAEQMAGQTDFLARAFKTKGEEIAAGFEKLGNRATRAGIDAGEQMAVIAALQKDMGGGAGAGEAFKSLIDNAGKAGRALGVSFTDQKGQMLPVLDILEKLRAKYGDAMTEAQQINFSKALGDKNAGAFINTLLSKQGQLTRAIKDVKGVTDMTGARASARQTTDAFQRFGASLEYVRANFMQKLLPTLERWTNKASDHLDTLNKWITRYPNLTRVLGYALLALLAVGAGLALLTAVFAFGKLAVAPFIKVISGLGGVFKFLWAAIRANPLGFLIWLVTLCILYWDETKAVIGWVWDKLRGFFEWIGPAGKPFLDIMDDIEAGWEALTKLFSKDFWSNLLGSAIDKALGYLESFIRGIGDVLDYVPGMGEQAEKLKKYTVSRSGPAPAKTEAPGLAAVPAAALAPNLPGGAANIETIRSSRPELASLQEAKTLQVKQGGVMGSYNSSSVRNSGKTVSIGEQHFHIENVQDMDEMMAMAMG
jgi:TP901 family phage tail tape measure protein